MLKNIQKPRKNRKKFICRICFTSQSSTKKSTLLCSCPACTDCLSEWLTLKIPENQYSIGDNIPCVMARCKQASPLKFIYRGMPNIHQEKLNESLLQVYLTKNHDVQKCPKSNCNYAGIIDEDSECQSPLQCDLCGTTWRGKQLEKFFEWLRNDAEAEGQSQKWINLYSKKCPSCHVNIQKDGGCDHMTCKKCGYQFWWMNLQKYLYYDQVRTTNLNLNQHRTQPLHQTRATQFSLKRFLYCLIIIKLAVLLILRFLFKDLFSSVCITTINTISFVFKDCLCSVFVYIVEVIPTFCLSCLRLLPTLSSWILSSFLKPLLHIWVLNGLAITLLILFILSSLRRMKMKCLTPLLKEENRSSMTCQKNKRLQKKKNKKICSRLFQDKQFQESTDASIDSIFNVPLD